MKKDAMHYIELIIYYTILFFILREWLVPIMDLTSTGHLNLFMIFIAISFLINIFRVPMVFSWIIKLAFIGFFLITVYSDESPFTIEGLSYLFYELRMNISFLLSSDLSAVTNPFRTILFFVLIWMLVYLLHHWITVRMTIFYFFVLTVFFIATLDTFTDYDGTMAIVKVVLLGLMMTAFLYLKRLITTTGTAVAYHKFFLYILPVTLFIGVVGFVAILLPKAEPIWPDPVPYMKGIIGMGSGTSQVGLGEDDTELGGSFNEDDTVVFQVHARKKQYWRVETKDFYTSKGWETSMPAEDMILEDSYIPSTIPIGTPEKIAYAEIYPRITRSYVMQPYGITKVNIEEPNTDIFFNMMTERVSTKQNGEDFVPEKYTVEYSTPQYSYTALKTEIDSYSSEPRYLQLPNTLPTRVYELAHELTASRKTEYDKARAIEQYFKNNGFVYETKNVPVPGEGIDYVDQFLFETKRGYCDNFSTSMVVMLRAIGIDARWVKGYASGTEVGRTDDGLLKFDIANNDAHSWVEAYIEGVGWMQFEPTIGFTNPTDINYDIKPTDNRNDQLLEEQKQEKKQQKEEQKAQEKVEKKKTKAATPVSPIVKWIGASAGIILVLLAVMLYKRRRKWLPKVYVRIQRGKPNDASNFSVAYKRLIKQLSLYGLKRTPDETLQSFAQRVDEHFGTDDMSKITAVYEKVIYSKNIEHHEFNEIKESWENLINRTTC